MNQKNAKNSQNNSQNSQNKGQNGKTENKSEHCKHDEVFALLPAKGGLARPAGRRQSPFPTLL